VGPRSLTARLVLLVLLAPAPFLTSGAAAGRAEGSRRHAVIVVGSPRVAMRPGLVDGRPQGVLDMNVRPRATQVWIDGRLRGRCGAFDGTPGKLHVAPGLRDLRLVTPEGVRVTRQLRVRAGVELNVSLDLR
jgi:hypothetical protein